MVRGRSFSFGVVAVVAVALLGAAAPRQAQAQAPTPPPNFASSAYDPLRAAFTGAGGGTYPRSVGEAEGALLDRVTINNEKFVKNNQEFHFIGFNQYYMLDKARKPDERHIVDETLKDAKDLGMTVMRTWAFDDRPEGLQTSAGVFDEATFRALDYVLDSSARHGVHVILALVNYWSDYGGMESYVKWCTDRPTIANASVTEFYTNPVCRQMYKNAMQTIMTRRNTINGRFYSEDPTILGWDLANEPRNPGDPSSNTLSYWIEEMSQFAKLISPRQLVTTGVEGFFGLTTPNLALNSNPGSDSWDSWICEGTDFMRFHNLPSIDFTVAHMYPDLWVDRSCNGSDYCKKLFASRWVDTHIEQSIILGKPFVLEEFGATARPGDDYRSSMNHREDIFETVFTEMEEAAAASDISVGSLFWSFSSLTYPDYDGFTVYYGGEGGSADTNQQQGNAGEDLDHPGVNPSAATGGGAYDSLWSEERNADQKEEEEEKEEEFRAAPLREEEDKLDTGMDYIWVQQLTNQFQKQLRADFRNAKKHKQCAKYLRKSVREGRISSSYREKPPGSETTLVAFQKIETSHDDTINIIANAAKKFRRFSGQDSYYYGG